MQEEDLASCHAPGGDGEGKGFVAWYGHLFMWGLGGRGGVYSHISHSYAFNDACGSLFK